MTKASLLFLGGWLLATNPAVAAQKEDALLELLVRKGTITRAEADAVRSEHDKQIADQVALYDKTKVAPWIKSFQWTGDLRLRHESYFWDENQADRHLERFRLRLGARLAFADDKTIVALRLATGALDNPSGHDQTFNDTFAKKPILIDQAYVRYQATDWLTLWGGKMPIPFSLVRVDSPVIWDDDITPEGLAEQVRWPVTKRTTLFATAAQMPVKELSASVSDPWLFGEQVGVETKLTDAVSLKVAGHFFHTVHVENATRTDSQMRGNTIVTVISSGKTNVYFAADYAVLGLAGELSWTLPGPLLKSISLHGEFDENVATYYGNDDTTGWLVGFRLNDAKKKGDWEFAYAYKHLEADTFWDAISDSNWGTGGTDRAGHSVAFTYNLQDWWQARVRAFLTRKLSDRPADNKGVFPEDLVRLQLETNWKF